MENFAQFKQVSSYTFANNLGDTIVVGDDDVQYQNDEGFSVTYSLEHKGNAVTVIVPKLEKSQSQAFTARQRIEWCLEELGFMVTFKNQ